MNFKVGDVVIKNTGGDKMVVDIIFNEGIIYCLWFDDETLNKEYFNVESLTLFSNYVIVNQRDFSINEILN